MPPGGLPGRMISLFNNTIASFNFKIDDEYISFALFLGIYKLICLLCEFFGVVAGVAKINLGWGPCTLDVGLHS